MTLDDLDRALLLALLERPRVGLREHARTLGVARGTVQARFVRLQEVGVITGFAPRVSPSALGYEVSVLTTNLTLADTVPALADQQDRAAAELAEAEHEARQLALTLL